MKENILPNEQPVLPLEIKTFFDAPTKENFAVIHRSKLNNYRVAEYVSSLLTARLEAHPTPHLKKLYSRLLKACFIAIAAMDIDNRNFTRAEAFLRKVFEIKPSSVAGRVLGGKLETKRGNLEEARKYFTEGLELEPKNGFLLFSLGNWERHFGDLNKAEKYLLEAHKRLPNDILILVSLGGLEVQRGNFDKGEDYFKMVLEKKPNDVLVKYYLVLCYRLGGKLNKAREMLVHLIETLPENDRGLKFWILTEFYIVSPESPLWPILEERTGIRRVDLIEDANNRINSTITTIGNMDYGQNPVWKRNYSSLPVNKSAKKGISDPFEVDKDYRKENG